VKTLSQLAHIGEGRKKNNHEPSIIDSEDEIVSILDTKQDGTADSVHQGLSKTNIMSTVEPTNGNTSNNDELNTKVGTSPTRLFKDTPNPERTSDEFLKPTTPKRKGDKSSNDPIQPVIPTTVIDTSEAAKLKVDLEAKDIILRDYEEQINYFRYLYRFSPIPKELTSTTRWTPIGSLPTALRTPTYKPGLTVKCCCLRFGVTDIMSNK
jgi:hypothetical protein